METRFTLPGDGRTADALFAMEAGRRDSRRPRVDQGLASLVDEQRGWSISEELQRRIINSATLSARTARPLTRAFPRKDRPFDLLIYEEAGRALPLELLGPMTSARAGCSCDPEQLPPHQAPDLARILAAGLGSDAEKDKY